MIARISIPCMTVYSNRDIKERLIIDIINAIYQYCLYEKKIEDIKNQASNSVSASSVKYLNEKNGDIQNKKGKFRPKLSEHNLIKLWEHMLQTMGGKFYDSSMIKLSEFAFVVSLFAIILNILNILINFDWLAITRKIVAIISN